MFKETGGLRENMTAARLEARHAAADPTSRRQSQKASGYVWNAAN